MINIGTPDHTTGFAFSKNAGAKLDIRPAGKRKSLAKYGQSRLFFRIFPD
ncbi:MAG: hypothetical protein KDC61_06625 [Saprospiraceae bacterium]|nr:hypothetical protein [Saprospiraceae bacterium]MCB9305588.1 hypothetical protein [Lewinellaceae bacterium]